MFWQVTQQLLEGFESTLKLFCITLVAAHRRLVVSCTVTALPEFFQYQPGHVGLADIRAGAGYKKFLCHDQSSQSCGL